VVIMMSLILSAGLRDEARLDLLAGLQVRCGPIGDQFDPSFLIAHDFPPKRDTPMS
jgi:hypothetical protein